MRIDLVPPHGPVDSSQEFGGPLSGGGRFVFKPQNAPR